MINLAYQTKTNDYYCIQLIEVIEDAIYSGQVSFLTKTRVSDRNDLVSLQIINKNSSAIFKPATKKEFAFYLEDGNYNPEENDLEEVNNFIQRNATNLIRLVRENTTPLEGIDRVFDPTRAKPYKGSVPITSVAK